MDSRAKVVLELYDELKSERSALDALWQDIAKRVWPDYLTWNKTPDSREGDDRTFELVDSTGAVALDRFAAAYMKMTAPSNRKWHRLTTADEGLSNSAPVKLWCSLATDVLFRRRYAKDSNFAAQYFEGCKTMGAFGPMATFIEDVPDIGQRVFGRNRYTSLNLVHTFFTEDAWRRVNGFVRLVPMTAAQMAEKFGKDALPAKVAQALDSKSGTAAKQRWEVIHCVQPAGYIADSVRGFTFLSRYVCREGAVVLAEGGYRTFPLAAARFSTMPGEVYGRSPAMLVLPSLKMLNRMAVDYLRAVHRAVDPPLLAHDDGVLSIINNAPGKVTMGTVSEEGRPMVIPLQTGANIAWAQEAMDDSRRPINDIFLVSLFQILAEEPRTQTATEVVQREAEKATLIAPNVERIQSEYHYALIERELSLAVEAGELPPMPPELEGGQAMLKVEYLGDLAQAQKAEEVVGIMRAAEVAPQFAALDPASVQAVNWGGAYARAAEGFGMPQEFIRSAEEIEAAAAQQQQMQQAALLAQGVPAAAAASKDFAQAEQIRQTSKAAVGALI